MRVIDVRDFLEYAEDHIRAAKEEVDNNISDSKAFELVGRLEAAKRRLDQAIKELLR